MQHMSPYLSRSAVLKLLGLLPISLALSLTPALAKPGSGTPWQVYNYDAFWILHGSNTTAVPGGVAGFSFRTSPTTAMLTTTQQSSLLGDLTGKTISATVGVTVTSGSPTFTYANEPDACNGPASVHLFFSTSAQTYNPTIASSGNNEVNYWWSNPYGTALQALTSGDSTISAALQGGNWSDANGHWGSDPNYAAGFAAAVKNVRQIGLSFGGGCYFDNGVGVQPGTGAANFRLMSYTAQ